MLNNKNVNHCQDTKQSTEPDPQQDLCVELMGHSADSMIRLSILARLCNRQIVSHS